MDMLAGVREPLVALRTEQLTVFHAVSYRNTDWIQMQDARDQFAAFAIVDIYGTKPAGINTGYIACNRRRHINGANVGTTWRDPAIFKQEILGQEHLIRAQSAGRSAVSSTCLQLLNFPANHTLRPGTRVFDIDRNAVHHLSTRICPWMMGDQTFEIFDTLIAEPGAMKLLQPVRRRLNDIPVFTCHDVSP
ncbi:hypothetical protein TB9_21220 [Xanthomonas perforans]|uniref:Uncharacterized protein n=1 Tax=Xanthomonas perforans TaxID=442694 RepID=A0ABR5EY77_XANPE|nr:hypothetical protein XP420_00215 [Xanthomonas perforans]OHX25553.1 hypothetical protein BHL63_12780 [Xanthomonas alfalfae]KLC12257.1 hypothetical protein XP315_00360 [Xanthomonas perforans]KLC24944.1 hypothetical protein XP712_00255 [Xanthomonas perforans]KLC27099.1 hypothetical protein XP816_00730 [Xanthomonas perforans]